MKNNRASDYLNEMIAAVIRDGTITSYDVYILVDLYGGDYESMMIDILSLVWKRKGDKELLKKAQEIFNEYRSYFTP